MELALLRLGCLKVGVGKINKLGLGYISSELRHGSRRVRIERQLFSVKQVWVN